MHCWGDENVDWNGIDDAADYIGMGLRKWGRVDVTQFKEKYGTVRVYCYLGITMFHQLIWPGYCFNQYPFKWMWLLDCKFFRVWKYINYLIIPFHRYIYRKYYANAIKKWPHLREEILCCADYDELLKGL